MTFNVGDRVISRYTGAGTVTHVGYENLRVLFDGVLGERLWEKNRLTVSAQVVDFLQRLCGKCKTVDITFEHGLRKYCASCNDQDNAGRDIRTKEEREEDELLEQLAVDYWLGVHNKSRAFSTYGKHDPLHKLPSVQVVRVKDRKHQATGHDVHLEPLPRKYADGLTVHTEGEYQARWTKPFTHSLDMPRKHNTFCAVCVEIVVDGDIDNVRITKGVYLPIEHQCSSVRLYDLRGTLLEVKPL